MTNNNGQRRASLIYEIACYLQENYATSGINAYLGGFDINTPDKNFAKSKRVYVQNLLKNENIEEIKKIARDLGLISNNPNIKKISDKLKEYTSDEVMKYWENANTNIDEDPENAITKARTILESVCKHILDELKVEYKNDGKLNRLYNKVSIELNLSPGRYNEEIFKQILSGGYSIVHGLSALRNDLSDSHGKSKKSYKPSPRHAEFAVNIAGSLAIFLIKTYENNKE